MHAEMRGTLSFLFDAGLEIHCMYPCIRLVELNKPSLSLCSGTMQVKIMILICLLYVFYGML